MAIAKKVISNLSGPKNISLFENFELKNSQILIVNKSTRSRITIFLISNNKVDVNRGIC